MKINPAVLNEHLIPIVRMMKKTGLDMIDSNYKYSLFKIGSKHSSIQYEDGMRFEAYGKPSVVGNEHHICLYIEESVVSRDWFRTSPVEKVIEDKEGFLITTKNSYYKLIRE